VFGKKIKRGVGWGEIIIKNQKVLLKAAKPKQAAKVNPHFFLQFSRFAINPNCSHMHGGINSAL